MNTKQAGEMLRGEARMFEAMVEDFDFLASRDGALSAEQAALLYEAHASFMQWCAAMKRLQEKMRG